MTLTPPALALDDAKHLVRAYIMATNCIPVLFDGDDLLDDLLGFLGSSVADTTIPVSGLHLVLVIGAQTSPTANDPFGYGHIGRYVPTSPEQATRWHGSVTKTPPRPSHLPPGQSWDSRASAASPQPSAQRSARSKGSEETPWPATSCTSCCV